MSIGLRTGERGALIGMTGRGKSFLARHYLLPRTGRLVIIDPKGEWRDFPGCEVFDSVAEIERRKPDRCIYAARTRELRDKDAHDAIYSWVYDRGNTYLYTDEITSMLTGYVNGPPGFHDIYARGRSRKITVLTATQDPARVPLAIFRQARRFYAFRVVWPDDVDRMDRLIPGYSDFMPPSKEQLDDFTAEFGWRPDPRYGFVYWNNDTDDPARLAFMRKPRNA